LIVPDSRRYRARLVAGLDNPAVAAGMIVAGLVFALAQFNAARIGQPAYAVYDAHAYWLAGGSNHPYAATIASGFDDSVNPYKYRYPPPLAQVFSAVHWIPWPVVAFGWTALLFVTLLVLTGRWAPLVLVLPPTLLELQRGNINLLVALAIVVGMRWPAAWAFVLLTKITPGIGLLWYVTRREWRPLGVALGTTLVLASISFLLAPNLWFEFRNALVVQAGGAEGNPMLAIQVSLPIRLLISAAVVIYGARTNRAWLVPVACTIAAPALWWNVLVILIAAVPLAEGRRLGLPPSILPRGRRAPMANARPGEA
jgi:hypothetical protein